MTDIIMWATIEFGVSGYILHQIQKEKKMDKNTDENQEN
jgi:hypothetical protein